jgi:hypothetical protein
LITLRRFCSIQCDFDDFSADFAGGKSLPEGSADLSALSVREKLPAFLAIIASSVTFQG